MTLNNHIELTAERRDLLYRFLFTLSDRGYSFFHARAIENLVLGEWTSSHQKRIRYIREALVSVHRTTEISIESPDPLPQSILWPILRNLDLSYVTARACELIIQQDADYIPALNYIKMLSELVDSNILELNEEADTLRDIEEVDEGILHRYTDLQEVPILYYRPDSGVLWNAQENRPATEEEKSFIEKKASLNRMFRELDDIVSSRLSNSSEIL